MRACVCGGLGGKLHVCGAVAHGAITSNDTCAHARAAQAAPCAARFRGAGIRLSPVLICPAELLRTGRSSPQTPKAFALTPKLWRVRHRINAFLLLIGCAQCARMYIQLLSIDSIKTHSLLLAALFFNCDPRISRSSFLDTRTRTRRDTGDPHIGDLDRQILLTVSKTLRNSENSEEARHFHADKAASPSQTRRGAQIGGLFGRRA